MDLTRVVCALDDGDEHGDSSSSSSPCRVVEAEPRSLSEEPISIFREVNVSPTNMDQIVDFVVTLLVLNEQLNASDLLVQIADHPMSLSYQSSCNKIKTNITKQHSQLEKRKMSF